MWAEGGKRLIGTMGLHPVAQVRTAKLDIQTRSEPDPHGAPTEFLRARLGRIDEMQRGAAVDEAGVGKSNSATACAREAASANGKSPSSSSNSRLRAQATRACVGCVSGT